LPDVLQQDLASVVFVSEQHFVFASVEHFVLHSVEHLLEQSFLFFLSFFFPLSSSLIFSTLTVLSSELAAIAGIAKLPTNTAKTKTKNKFFITLDFKLIMKQI
jgi:hypothetical protein